VTPSTNAVPQLSGAALHEAKLALRAERLAARDAIPEALRGQASGAIAAGVARLASFVTAPVVLLTLPFRSEWDTRPLVRLAQDAGMTVVLPRVVPEQRMLRLYAITDLDRDIELGFQDIPEPRTACPCIAPDAIAFALVPGVAFDPVGARLGYGGGFYDRLLPLLAAGTPVVAGAFETQVVERVPVAPHDLRVDTLVTELRTFDCAGARR
jgi:5-formyltetrahydrofolate cyclo-ligase